VCRSFVASVALHLGAPAVLEVALPFRCRRDNAKWSESTPQLVLVRPLVWLKWPGAITVCPPRTTGLVVDSPMRG